MKQADLLPQHSRRGTDFSIPVGVISPEAGGSDSVNSITGSLIIPEQKVLSSRSLAQIHRRIFFLTTHTIPAPAHVDGNLIKNLTYFYFSCDRKS